MKLTLTRKLTLEDIGRIAAYLEKLGYVDCNQLEELLEREPEKFPARFGAMLKSIAEELQTGARIEH